MTNPEKPVIDDIDELIASECDEHGVPLDDYNRDRYVRCELCHQDWHGEPNEVGCPGAYATEEQLKSWTALCLGNNKPYIGYLTTEYEGQLCTVHLYMDGRGGYIGLLSPGVERSGERDMPPALYTFNEAMVTLTMHSISEDVQLPIMQGPQGFSDIGYIGDTP